MRGTPTLDAFRLSPEMMSALGQTRPYSSRPLHDSFILESGRMSWRSIHPGDTFRGCDG
jgi:hypothetical protein